MADVVKTRVSFVGSKLATAKAVFASMMTQVENTVAEAIRSGAMQVVDYAMYAVRELKADTSIELLQSSDSKEVGITNLNDRKLDINNFVLITGIQLLEASFSKAYTAVTKEDLKTAAYGQISNVVANGELDIKMNDRVLLPRISCEVFKRGSQTYGDSALVGYMPWECPKMVQPLTEIVPTLWVPVATNDTAVAKAVKFILHGVKTNKN